MNDENLGMKFAIILFVLGLFWLFAAFWQLFVRSNEKSIDHMTDQTLSTVQKGLGIEFSGLVLGASDILNSLDNIVKTRAGIGVVFCVVGGLHILAAIILVTY